VFTGLRLRGLIVTKSWGYFARSLSGGGACDASDSTVLSLLSSEQASSSGEAAPQLSGFNQRRVEPQRKMGRDQRGGGARFIKARGGLSPGHWGPGRQIAPGGQLAGSSAIYQILTRFGVPAEV